MRSCTGNEMGRCTGVIVLLCVVSVFSRNTLDLRKTADYALVELRTHKLGFKLPEGPIEPAQVIIIILRNYCQLLIDQGVANLPDYCYTLPRSPVINTAYKGQPGSIIDPYDGGIGRPAA